MPRSDFLSRSAFPSISPVFSSKIGQFHKIMGASRLGSDVSVPQRDFSQLTVTLASTGVAQRFNSAIIKAESLLIYAPSANVASVNIGPTSGASYRPLSPGDEFRIPLDTQSCFDLHSWYAKGTSGDTLVCIYQ